MKNTNPTSTAAWKDLSEAAKNPIEIKSLFKEDPNRFKKYSVRFKDILLDYSKNGIDERILSSLLALANQTSLKEAIDDMFSGKPINATEGRAVLHTALRNRSNDPVYVDGKDVMPEVNEVLEKMKVFSEKVSKGVWKGYTGKPIESLVNIGIGGSDLGPVMVTEALKPYQHPHIKTYFVSNVDGSHITEVLKQVNPETTMFLSHLKPLQLRKP